MESQIREIVSHVIREMRGLIVEEPLTKQEAAKYLKISVRCMEKRFKDGKLPSSLIHRNEGSIYFLPSELHQFIKAS